MFQENNLIQSFDKLIEAAIVVTSIVSLGVLYSLGFLSRFLLNPVTFWFSVIMLTIFILVWCSSFFRALKMFSDWVFWSEMIVMLGLLGTVSGIANAVYALNFPQILAGQALSSLEAFKLSLVYGMDTTIVGIVLVLVLFLIFAWRQHRGYA